MTHDLVRFGEPAKAWAVENTKSSNVSYCVILLVKGTVMKFKARFYTLMSKPNNKTVIMGSLELALEFIKKDRKERQVAKKMAAKS
jgi:uncharacterized protein (UPF0548 family)